MNSCLSDSCFDEGTSLSRRFRTSLFPSFSSVDRFSSLFNSQQAHHPLRGAGSVRDLHPIIRRSSCGRRALTRSAHGASSSTRRTTLRCRRTRSGRDEPPVVEPHEQQRVRRAAAHAPYPYPLADEDLVCQPDSRKRILERYVNVPRNIQDSSVPPNDAPTRLGHRLARNGGPSCIAVNTTEMDIAGNSSSVPISVRRNVGSRGQESLPPRIATCQLE
jgi:hypothetical protein